MHKFVRKFQSRLQTGPIQMNCCLSMKQVSDNVGSTRLILPDGTEIWVRYPQFVDECGSENCGEVYLSDYDIWSPELPAEELGDWVTNQLDCCRRVDAYFDAQKAKMRKLNSSINPDLATRIKTVWRSAQAGVDLPKGFRYTEFRSEEDWVKSTLVYYSEKLHQQTWIVKSALSLEPDPDKADTDGWAFQPDFRPLTEAIHQMRPGYSVDMGTELYVNSFPGDTPEQRDRKAAYWLVGILSEMLDKALETPPPRCYPVLLADHAANLKKSDLDRMSIQGVISLLNAGILTGEQVLKGKPELFKKLLQKGAVSGEMVARKLPEQIFWLARNKYISPDYALKLQPSLRDKLVKAGLYNTTDLSGYTSEQLLQGVKDGTLQPIDVYRANPKMLRSLVENQFITPQEAYKLDASIVTWLLINHYIGREEAKKVKSDIERYMKQKHKEVDWESLDASKKVNMIRYEGGQTTAAITGKLTEKNLQNALIAAIKEDPDTPTATVKAGDLTVWVAPAGYDDNARILDGKLSDAIVYVTLTRDYEIIRTSSGSLDARMKGSDVIKYINDAKNATNPATKQKDPKAANLDSSTKSTTSRKRAPRQLKINSSTAVRARLAGDRVIDGIHYFCVEGKNIGNQIQYQNQLQTYIPGYEVSSSGFNDRLYVAAPESAKDVVEIAVQHFNRDLVSDLNCCDGVTQVGDIAQKTTFTTKNSINSDMTDVNKEINKELGELGNLALSELTPLKEATATGPAWKVTIKYPGDLLSDYTTSILIPAVDKAAAQIKFNEKMSSDASIISWDEPVNNLDEYREKYPLSNLSVLE